jgi:DNA-binding HxlR family transcriptional regulator
MARRTYGRFCPLSMALEQVGDRWTLHIVYSLLSGPKRYAELRSYLAGAGSNVLSDRLRHLAEARIVSRTTGDRPGAETTYHLTERGLELAPVVQALVRWGLASLTLTAPGSPSRPEREVFDQRWAMPNEELVAEEAYQWTVDGVELELVVSGHSLTRTRGPARNPVVTLATTSAVLKAILTGERTIADATNRGEMELTGENEAIQRMFAAMGFPAQLLASR